MAFRYKGPLRAFRIARAKFPIFDGSGAAVAGALLEILVHSNLGRVPRGFASIEIHIPAAVEIEEITSEDLANWDAPDCLASRAFGSAWYVEVRSAVLVVPSVPGNGMGRNILINQEHPQFRLVSASEPRAVRWDRRLFRRGKKNDKES